MEHLSNDHEDDPNQHENSHKLCNKTGHPVFSLQESQWKLTWSDFPNGGKAIVEHILASEEINKSRRAVGITVRDPSHKVNHMSKIIWDRKIITEFTRSISSTRICEPVLMIDVKVSKDKPISRWVDWQNLIYVTWNRIKNCA